MHSILNGMKLQCFLTQNKGNHFQDLNFKNISMDPTTGNRLSWTLSSTPFSKPLYPPQ